MNPFVCSVQPCTATRYEALGMCRTHYRRSRPRRVDPKVELPCDGCGTLVLKEKRARRYATVQCSDWLCRKWLTFGIGQTCELPADHWARMYGATSKWKAPRSTEIVCVWCGAKALRWHGNATHCSTACTHRSKRAVRRAREFNASGRFTWTEITKLWVVHNKACAYCHKATALTDIQAEHVHPLSKGGRNDIGNMLPSCGPCNSDKRDLSLSEWAHDRQRRSLPAVTTAWDDLDPRYAHLVTQTVPLSAA